jgi:hypothetical protein
MKVAQAVLFLESTSRAFVELQALEKLRKAQAVLPIHQGRFA